MNKITLIEEQKKNNKRFNVYINEKFAFGLDEEIIYKYRLKEGMEIQTDFIEDILKKEQQIKANNYAIRIIEHHSKTVKQLKDKMKEKGYEEEFINNSIQFLQEYNYINDEKYAKQYINDKVRFGKDGRNKIKMNLMQKGVDKEIIQEQLNDIDSDLETDNAFELAERKMRSYKSLDLPTQRRRLYSFLQRKGYKGDIINKVMNKIFKNIDD